MPLEGIDGFRRNRVDWLFHSMAKYLNEMRDQGKNVFPSLSKCRYCDREDIQTIVQIAAKLTSRYHVDQILIGRCNQPDIDFMGLTISRSFELLFLQHAQQLGLQRSRDVAHFVQEQRTLIGHFKAPDLLCDRSRKGALLMTDSSLSNKSNGIAAQFSFINGRPKR